MDDLATLNGFTALLAGIGLSASAGFRVFVPLLVMAVGGKMEVIEVGDSFQWLHSWPAILALGTATTVEVAGYYIPWLDNLLDTVATPGAFASGTLLTASVMPELPLYLDTLTAVLAGGGAAGSLQLGTVMTRAVSTASSGGVANPVVSTGETVGSIVTSILALIIPIIIACFVFIIFLFILFWWLRRRKAHRAIATTTD